MRNIFLRERADEPSGDAFEIRIMEDYVPLYFGLDPDLWIGIQPKVTIRYRGDWSWSELSFDGRSGRFLGVTLQDYSGNVLSSGAADGPETGSIISSTETPYFDLVDLKSAPTGRGNDLYDVPGDVSLQLEGRNVKIILPEADLSRSIIWISSELGLELDASGFLTAIRAAGVPSDAIDLLRNL